MVKSTCVAFWQKNYTKIARAPQTTENDDVTPPPKDRERLRAVLIFTADVQTHFLEIYSKAFS